MRLAVVVMGKLPRPGSVKTRLARVLGEDAAVALYAAFLADTFALVDEALRNRADVARIFACVAPTPAELDEAATLAPEGWSAVPQRGDDLGARMGACVEGSDATVLVGSDAPAVGSRRIGEALELLTSAHGRRAVFVPTLDGGYCLIGTNGPIPELLSGVPWSTSAVMATTRARAKAAGLELLELGESYDVDEADDLVRLAGEVESGLVVAEHTRRVLEARPELLARLRLPG